jgi:hypothetical protein
MGNCVFLFTLYLLIFNLASISILLKKLKTWSKKKKAMDNFTFIGRWYISNTSCILNKYDAELPASGHPDGGLIVTLQIVTGELSVFASIVTS